MCRRMADSQRGGELLPEARCGAYQGGETSGGGGGDSHPGRRTHEDRTQEPQGCELGQI